MSAIEHELDRRGLIYRDPALTLHLANLAQPFLPPAAPANVEWQFKIVLDPAVNAFSLPSGSVYVTSGLLAALENDDQLSVVPVHEIAHVVGRHMYLTLRTSRKRQLAKSKGNQTRAQNPFRRASAADTRLAPPHACLGMLFEQMGREIRRRC